MEKQMIKSSMVLTATLLLLISTASFAEKSDASISRETTLNKWFYLKYSHGLSIYLTDVKNGLLGLTDKEIRAGMTIQPELGVCINNRLQLGISYLYMDGIAELDGGALGIFYDDVFFSGAAFKARYYLVNREKIRVPVGIEYATGECMMFSGVTEKRGEIRGMGQDVTAWLNSYSYYSGKGYGGGISGSFMYQPFRFFSFGMDAVLRIITSEAMEESRGLSWILTEMLIQTVLEDFSFDEHNNVKLNFSSLNLNAFVSFHF